MQAKLTLFSHHSHRLPEKGCEKSVTNVKSASIFASGKEFEDPCDPQKTQFALFPYADLVR